MSAPTQELPVEEQPSKQPGGWDLPAGGSWLMSEHSELLVVPGVPATAWLVGEFLIRPALHGQDMRSALAIVALVLLFALSSTVSFVLARSITRGEDGRSY